MPSLWLLEEDTAHAMEQAYKTGNIPSAQAQADYEASLRADSANGPRLLTIAGDIAVINVTGVLTSAPNLMAKWFGGGNTVYSDIRDAVASADANPSVHAIQLNVSSPGGEANAEWMATIDSVASAKKQVNGYVGSVAASAAYGIVAQADTIVAQNKLSRVGSIGVVASFYNDTNVVSITSTKAPNKRPDINSAEGKAAVTAELDQMHDIFVEAVATGRKVTAKTVNADFGRGGMLLAADAVKAGMIDGLASASRAGGHTSIAANGGTEGVQTMDMQELKTKHPETYAQIVAVGVDQGVKAERDRVTAHITMGTATDSQDVALKAIQDGEPMTATLTATYMAAGINKRDGKNRATEDAAAAAALANAAANGANTNATADAAADEVAALVAAQFGGDEE